MNNICHSISTPGKARLEYEYAINKLKLDYYRLQELKTAGEKTEKLEKCFKREKEALSELFHKIPELAATASSFFVVPTFELPGEQRLIHRIWLGGLPPFKVNEAVRQWFSAINHVGSGKTGAFRQILWVWQQPQINEDPRFRSRRTQDPFQIGEIVTKAGVMQVNALQILLSDLTSSNNDFITQLHQQGYYATLSDYFRLLILIRYGGVYMDADTLPYRPVSWFLFKPELPAIQHFPPKTAQPVRLSWLNLFLDETGMIIAAKGESALQEIFLRLNQAYAAFEQKLLAKNAVQERQLFDLFYAIWREHWGTTFISHDDFCQRYAVFARGEKEEVLCGVRGMRLLEDIISGEYRPLSASEKSSYQRAVRQLEAVNWTLNDPLSLEQYCEVYSLREVPRIAYSLQMRSDVEHFHYYGVLSTDPVLDRVNALFEQYLLAKNGSNIDRGNFWQGTVATDDISPGKRAGLLCFVAGSSSSEEDRNRMARLIFTTSYLEYCSVANPRKLDIISLQRAQNIDPWLDVITLVLRADGYFAGFFTAAPIAHFKQTPVDYLYREEMRPLDRDYDLFVEKNSHDKDYFIASLALEAAEHGRGYFPLIMAQIESQAALAGAERLTLCVWESASAFRLYKKWGFERVDSSERWQALFADRLHFLVKEISYR
ncbi:glycosyltransferase [Kalamiella sp. sgz302252]|uniref:glycosyltransferase n=1 Tax=Pantoea sp. sgz302252 TaxID=3341827 RepID=UPI0036D2411F